MKKMILAIAAICAFAATTYGAGSAAKKASKSAAIATNSWASAVGAAAKDAAVLKSTMAGLQSDKAAQLRFIKAVNEAIAQMPVSEEAKAQFSANAAKAALESVSKDNVTAAVAEIYATAPLGSLPAVNDVLAKTCFNRNADATKTYSDGEFGKKADQIMSAVSSRVAQDAKSGEEAYRDALAIDMLSKASGGKPSGLADTLADKFVPESDRAEAKDTWLPDAAKGDYNSFYSKAGVESDDEPDLSKIVVGTTGASETGASLLASIGSGEETSGGVFSTPLETGFNELQDGLVNDGLWSVPAGKVPEEEPPVPPTPYGDTVP